MSLIKGRPDAEIAKELIVNQTLVDTQVMELPVMIGSVTCHLKTVRRGDLLLVGCRPAGVQAVLASQVWSTQGFTCTP